LTVSPVPLAATASEHHVLVATMLSKSVLRAAAGAMYARFDDVDYFPSYEVIATPFAGMHYEADLRSIKAGGVETVMDIFFAAHSGASHAVATAKAAEPATAEDDRATARDDVVCEEKLLEAFAT
jgi:hypothetical protein